MRSGYAALSVITLVLASACSANSESRHAAATAEPATSVPVPAVTESAPRSTASPAVRSIRNASTVAGATLSQAPAAIEPLLDTSTCGFVRITNRSRLEGLPGTGERRCFLDSLATRRLASLVTMADTIEGFPLVSVDVVLADGSTATFTDSSHDPYSSRQWGLGHCNQLAFDDGDLRVADSSWYLRRGCSPVDAIAPARSVTPPDFVTRRTELPLCGYELSRDQPNARARQCMRDAVANGVAAEFVYVNPNALGQPVTYWLRMTGTGSFEILMHYEARRDAPLRTWVRMDCDGFDVREGSNPVVTGSWCRNVETVQT